MDLGGNWEAVFPCMPARSLIYKFGFIGWQPRRVGDTVAPPRGRSGLQTLLANETADEERGSGENQSAGQRNAVGFWHSQKISHAEDVKGTRSEREVAFQGRSSAMRLTGWSAMRVSTSRM